MSGHSVELGFVAALEREVSGLVKGWSKSTVQSGGKSWRIYCDGRDGRAAVICAGTGSVRAYAAAAALVENCSPRVLVSIGFVGACVDSIHPGFSALRPGSIVVPASVVEVATGRTFATAFGLGRLATLDRVAGRDLKRDTQARFGAVAIDMEAAGVAAAAAEAGKEFAAIKAVSDGVDEDVGFLSDFVTPDGFATGRFVAHVAVRPWLWPRVAALQANSAAAAKSLESTVESCMKDWQRFAARYSKSAAQV
jgi:nucleoside phosphorylase